MLFLTWEKSVAFFIFWADCGRSANIAQITDFLPKMCQIARKLKIALFRRARSPRWVECLGQPAYGFLLLLRVESISLSFSHVMLICCSFFVGISCVWKGAKWPYFGRTGGTFKPSADPWKCSQSKENDVANFLMSSDSGNTPNNTEILFREHKRSFLATNAKNDCFDRKCQFFNKT